MAIRPKSTRPAGHIPTRPSVARVYNYLLGGRDNFTVDREHGQLMISAVRELPAEVRAQRAALRRAVRYLVEDAGVRQLLDIGAGLPLTPNVHQVARKSAPGTRVVYVDNDEVVLAYDKAMLVDSPEIIVVEGDLRDPDGIVGNPLVRAHLDWSQPIGVLLSGVMHLILDSDRPAAIMASLIGALPPGSYVYLQHLLDLDDPVAARLRAVMTRAFGEVQFRSLERVRELLSGLELVEPGIVRVPDWRPDKEATTPRGWPAALGLSCAGVGRKP